MKLSNIGDYLIGYNHLEYISLRQKREMHIVWNNARLRARLLLRSFIERN